VLTRIFKIFLLDKEILFNKSSKNILNFLLNKKVFIIKNLL
jgi:hypothetical protein